MKVPSGPPGLDPWSVIREATRAVPAVRYAVGIVGVVAAAALARSYFGSVAAAVLSTVIMLILMTLLYVFSRLVVSRSFGERLPVIVFLWLVILLFSFWSIALTAAVFFQFPRPLPAIFGRLNSNRKANPKLMYAKGPPRPLVFSGGRISVDALPIGVTAPPRAGGNTNPASALAGQPKLVLNGATLTIGSSSSPSHAALYVSKLVFRNGGRIVTNGSALDINALRISSPKGEAGKIISFDRAAIKPKPGKMGTGGRAGLGGGRVTIRGTLDPDAELDINLRGQDGGDGGAGLPGTSGAPGASGANGADSLFGCLHGGRDGQRGLPGGDGGTGGRGGNAGDGGTLVLEGPISSQLDQIRFMGPAGQRGAGGIGGPGGKGGRGGAGGHGSVYCGGGHGGPSGSDGRHGPTGMRGAVGKAGHIVFG